MRRQRAAILRRVGEDTGPYATELAQRGYIVDTYTDATSLMRALGQQAGELRLVVLDALSGHERRQLVKELVLANRYNVPQIFWMTEPGNTCVSDDFEQELIGPRDSVKVILHGDIETFRHRVEFIEAWIRRHPLPTLTIRHSRRRELLDRIEPNLYREWAASHGCDRFEAVVDVLVHGISIRDAGKALADPVRRLDLYWFDRLALAHGPLTLEDLTRSMTDEDSFPFAERMIGVAPDGFSLNSGKNSLKRIRGALTMVGLDGHRVIRHDEGAYYIDRSLVRVEVEHIME